MHKVVALNFYASMHASDLCMPVCIPICSDHSACMQARLFQAKASVKGALSNTDYCKVNGKKLTKPLVSEVLNEIQNKIGGRREQLANEHNKKGGRDVLYLPAFDDVKENEENVCACCSVCACTGCACSSVCACCVCSCSGCACTGCACSSVCACCVCSCSGCACTGCACSSVCVVHVMCHA